MGDQSGAPERPRWAVDTESDQTVRKVQQRLHEVVQLDPRCAPCDLRDCNFALRFSAGSDRDRFLHDGANRTVGSVSYRQRLRGENITHYLAALLCDGSTFEACTLKAEPLAIRSFHNGGELCRLLEDERERITAVGWFNRIKAWMAAHSRSGWTVLSGEERLGRIDVTYPVGTYPGGSKRRAYWAMNGVQLPIQIMKPALLFSGETDRVIPDDTPELTGATLLCIDFIINMILREWIFGLDYNG